jgi:hypothetical protein
MKIKTTVHVHYIKWDWDNEGRYYAHALKMDDTEAISYICEQEIEIEVPDNYDPRAQQIAALEAQKHKVMADYQKTVTDINDRISKLQSLEYTNATQ